MKKIYKKYLDKAIIKESESLIWQKYIFKEIIFDAGIKLVFLIFFITYCYYNYDKFVKLTNLTADTILNHEVFINPEAYYFVWLIVLGSICLIGLIGASILFKVLKKSYLKKIYIGYKIYDLLSFIASICVIINFIILFIITPVTIDGRSMEQTYHDGDKVLLWHFGYEPKNDDVVVIDATNHNDPNHFYIKRIVASPNDTLYYRDGYLYNGKDLIEKRLTILEWEHIKLSLDITENIYEIVMPNDSYLVFGDNRLNSTDSRTFGAINKDDIIGKVILRYYPFSDFGIPDKQVIF